MQVSKIIELLSHQSEIGDYYAKKRLARFATMSGWGLPDRWDHSNCSAEVPAEIAAKILSLDYGERATDNLRIMGEQMGKLNVSVPSNINVWGHTRGASTLAEAATALTNAVQTLAKK